MKKQKKNLELFFDNSREEFDKISGKEEIVKALQVKVANFNKALDKLSKETGVKTTAKVWFKLEAKEFLMEENNNVST